MREATGRKFIYDDRAAELVRRAPKHDDWHEWTEYRDEYGELWYVSDHEDYTLNAEEFGPIPTTLQYQLRYPRIELRQAEDDDAMALAYYQTSATEEEAVYVITDESIPSRPRRVRIGGRLYRSMYAAMEWIIDVEREARNDPELSGAICCANKNDDGSWTMVMLFGVYDWNR